MWKRSELKQEARASLKKNYGALILVCFIMAFMIGEYGASTTLIDQFSEEKQAVEKVETVNKAEPKEKSIITKNLSIGGINSKATKGILNNFTNQLGRAKSTLNSAFNVASLFMEKKSGRAIAFTIMGLVLSFLWLLFGKYILIVGERRFFLENINYHKTGALRILFLYRKSKILNPAKVMFMKGMFHTFWMLTIVGGCIKWYSYKMVPYILAENPNIHWKQAIKLSRQMMNGYKWKAFVLDLSFWYWYLLKALTMGLLGIFFLNAYLRGTEARLYEQLRATAQQANIDNIALLNDEDLYSNSDPNQLLYPGVETRKKREFAINYKRNYSVWNVILFFFTFSFVGWVYEVSIHLIKDGVFVDRGTMYGPWLPIYGTGGILILIVLKKFREKPALNFLMTMILCGVVEYMTSFILEKTQGLRWWDYSGYWLNLNGRICMEGLLVFAIGGAAFVYILAPLFDDLYNKIPMRAKIPIILLLLAAFGADSVYSHFHPNTGKGITDYGMDNHNFSANNNSSKTNATYDRIRVRTLE